MKWPWKKRKQQKVNLTMYQLISWYWNGKHIFDGIIIHLQRSSDGILDIRIAEKDVYEKEYKKGV